MSVLDSMWNRLATITKLVIQANSVNLGHTAIMKLAYFLQTLRDVPLGYNFRLYTYGPYDADVLGDLKYAEVLNAVTSKTIIYPCGYGYEIQKGESAKTIIGYASTFIDQHQKDIDWVMNEFGSYTASELELYSTIIYTDRNISERCESSTSDKIAELVHEIKPHFTVQDIKEKIDILHVKNLLKSLH